MYCSCFGPDASAGGLMRWASMYELIFSMIPAQQSLQLGTIVFNKFDWAAKKTNGLLTSGMLLFCV